MTRLILLIFLFTAGSLAAQKKTVVVAPFEKPSEEIASDFYQYAGTLGKVSALFENELFGTGIYDLVDKAWLGISNNDKLFEYGGEINREYISKLSGTDYLVMGTLSGFDAKNTKSATGTSYTYTVRVGFTVKFIEVKTGRVNLSITEEAEVTGKAEADGNNYNDNVDVRYVEDAAKKVVEKLVEDIKAKNSK